MAATLDDVVKAIKEGNQGTATQQAKATEEANEKKVYDNSVLSTLNAISEAIKGITPFKIKETDSKSFLGKILESFGLIGAGALGLASGLAAGWITYVGNLIKGVGKIVFGFVDAIPRPQFIDDIIASFSAEGKIGSIFTRIKNFFLGETSIFKRIGTALDAAIDGLKGFTGGLFTRINNFFGGELSPFKRIAKIVDPAIDIVKGFTGGIFTRIGSIFTSIKNVGVALATPLKSLGTVLGIGGDAAKAAGKSGGILKTLLGFLNPFSSIFRIMGSIGRVIATPLTIIMGAFDAFFEAKDAIEKGGEDAGLLEKITLGIVGALGGFIDGAILQVADLIKDGIAYLARFFGFETFADRLGSFSFSEIFNEMLDKIYEFVGDLFDIDFSKIIPSNFNFVDTILRAVLSLVPETFLGVGVRARVADAFGISGAPTGGAELMQGSARLDRGRNGSPTVVNINNSQNNPVVSNQTTTVKAADAVRSNEPSLLQTAYGAIAGVFN
tara:strand:- start:67 stop:1560 length:1494 start_codon:yes stop_codon:yes gene_type:complete